MNSKTRTSITAVLACFAVSFSIACSNSTTKAVPVVATILATSATVQSGTVGSSFPRPFKVTVVSNRPTAIGIPVTFAAPSSGPSGTFANGKTSETDTTDSNGVVTSSVFTANKTTGAYTVIAMAAQDPTPAQFDLTNTSAPA